MRTTDMEKLRSLMAGRVAAFNNAMAKTAAVCNAKQRLPEDLLHWVAQRAQERRADQGPDTQAPPTRSRERVN